MQESSISITTARQHCAIGVAELSQRCAALRGQAIDVLAAPLGGDKLAAEYLLLQLVSRYEHYYAAAYMPPSAASHMHRLAATNARDCPSVVRSKSAPAMVLSVSSVRQW